MELFSEISYETDDLAENCDVVIDKVVHIVVFGVEDDTEGLFIISKTY